MKARAYEMTGDYDFASTSYTAYKLGDVDFNRGSVLTSEPRLAYKRGKMDDAFRGYCDLLALEEEGLPSKEPARFHSPRFPKNPTSKILLLDYAEKDRVLSPFAEYSDFLAFMEEEFKAQGEPAKYAEAMEFFRSCAPDASNGDAGNKSVKAEESDVSDVSDVPEPDGETSKTQAEATK